MHFLCYKSIGLNSRRSLINFFIQQKIHLLLDENIEHKRFPTNKSQLNIANECVKHNRWWLITLHFASCSVDFVSFSNNSMKKHRNFARETKKAEQKRKSPFSDLQYCAVLDHVRIILCFEQQNNYGSLFFLYCLF